MSKVYDLVGQRFGRLVVLEKEKRNIPKTKRTCVWWRCECDCGSIVIVPTTRLVTGVTKSCGCYKADASAKRLTTHGHGHGERLYGVWSTMKQRCYYVGSPSYANYGAKGITVCDEWLHNYDSFRSWALSNGYDETAIRGKFTVDRIDQSKGYSPDNCRLVDMQVQNSNKRSNVYLTLNGETATLAEMARRHNISDSTLRGRLNSGWSVEDALTKPARVIRHTGKYVGVNQKYKKYKNKKEKFNNE